jgi:hypothetical protein
MPPFIAVGFEVALPRFAKVVPQTQRDGWQFQTTVLAASVRQVGVALLVVPGEPATTRKR